MLARYALICLLVELSVYVAGAVALARSGDLPALVLVGLGVLAAFAVRFVIVLASFVVARLAPPVTAERVAEQGLWTCSAMVCREAIATWVVFSVLQPLERWLGTRAPGAGEMTPALPVLLIHGYMCNGAFWWSIIRHLRASGATNLFTMNLEPAFAPVEHYVAQVRERVAVVRERCAADRVLIVAHSMGGLVARAYLRTPGASAHVAGLITLGSPHYGTVLAYFSPTPNARDMRPGSNFLERLAASETHGVPITSIYSRDDNIVAPYDSACLEGVRNLGLNGVGHVYMSFSAAVKALVVKELARHAVIAPPDAREAAP